MNSKFIKMACKVIVKEMVRRGASTNEELVENFIRDSLSGTGRATSVSLMFNLAKRSIKGLSKQEFMKIWNGLVKEKYLVPGRKGYMWEM